MADPRAHPESMPDTAGSLHPMMPELLALAQASPADGPVSHAFHDLEATEAMVGASNALPLALEILLGAFKPRLFAERRKPAIS